MIRPTADFVVVANRLPVDLHRTADGTATWRRSPGGLVAALTPVLQTHNGAWVGWAGAGDIPMEPFTDDGLHLHPVDLSRREIEDYYEGFANATLWPLYHDLVVKPRYDRSWWQSYVAVNRRFARAAADVAAPSATVWVQDYQLQLVPQMLRRLRPDLTIGFFLHIPFPPPELFVQLPWRRQIIDGLLGADLVGFQLPGGAENFVKLVATVTGHQTGPDPEMIGTVLVDRRQVAVGAFPISIDTEQWDRQARSPAVRERAAQLRADLGDPATLLLGVDRLDYTKGIDLRLHALDELFAEGRLDPHTVTLLQLAVPSREHVAHYDDQRRLIEHQVSRLNGHYSTLSHSVVHYLHRQVAPETLQAMFVAADVMLVTPLRDGMNLVAKEYVACRAGGDGALVLSELTGVAAELTDAYLVNPHDIDGIKDAVVSAVTDDSAETRRRMAAMRTHVFTHDVHRWADSFLTRLTQQHRSAAQPAPPSTS